MVGNIAVSMAGHDKGDAYVIVKEDAAYVYLCDGRLKTLEKPKRKSRKHVAVNQSFDTGETGEKLQEGSVVYDHEIRRIMKLYNMHVKKAEV
jgi:ribosomal protein L14E/L6E/L27E